MLDRFKSFDTERMDVDDLVALAAFGRQLRAEYEALQLEEPEFVDVQIKTLRREIHARNQDNLAARKRTLQNQLEALQTPTEKKAKLQKQLADINKQLQEVGA